MSLYSDVTLIIVCYNSEKLIEKNLSELKKFQAVIVDNSKSTKIFDLVKNFKNITYVKTNKNLGFGKANNLGVSKSKTPYIMILNPDILIDVEAIQKLYEKYSLYENVGILAPSLYDINNIRRSNGSTSRLKKKIGKSLKNNNKNFAEGDACYDFVIGCSLFMSKDLFINLGGFDENFFLYFEDNDICDRVYHNNKFVMEVPDSKMIHLQGLSSTYNTMTSIKLSIIHKVSEYIYYSKYFNSFKLYSIIIGHFFDYLQRSFKNLFLLKFKKFFQNILRIISIFLFITKLYYLIY